MTTGCGDPECKKKVQKKKNLSHDMDCNSAIRILERTKTCIQRLVAKKISVKLSLCIKNSCKKPNYRNLY